MPVRCPLALTPISKFEFGDLDFQVMQHVFECQNLIGPLASEQVYRTWLAHRLEAEGFSTHQEVPVHLNHKSFEKTLRLDLVVAGKGVYELKAVSALHESHVSQLLTYLYLLDLPRGKLVNFGSSRVESKFVNTVVSRAERIGFSVDVSSYVGEPDFCELVIELLRDWGTALNGSLYEEAIIHLLGGETVVKRKMPLRTNEMEMGPHPFNMIDPSHGFVLTTFPEPPFWHRKNLQRLIALTNLQSLQWVNVSRHVVSFTTVLNK